MTAIMVPAAGSSGGGTQIARNNRGRAVVPGLTTVTLVSFTSGTHLLRGFHVEGETEGFAWIEVDGVALDGMAAHHSVAKEAYRLLPNPEAYATTTTVVALRITNLTSNTAEFQGVVFGE